MGGKEEKEEQEEHEEHGEHEVLKDSHCTGLPALNREPKESFLAPYASK